MATGISSPLALGGLYPSVDGGYVAANGRPFTSVSNAESALNGFPSKLSESCVGLTVLVADENDPDYPKAKEYWVQPKGTTPETYGLVEKGVGTTDYNDLDNKPTIGDGTNTALPIVGNVKVSASTASGSTAGVTVTPGQNAGEIEMRFTLPQGDDAYEVYLEKYKEEHSGSTDGAMSKDAWLASLKGADGTDGQDGQDGAPGHNPCLGRYNTLPDVADLPETPRAGDYIYVDDKTDPSNVVTTLYKYDATSQTGFDQGTIVDVNNVTFRNGQAVGNFGIDDEPTAGSENLVKSGGMYLANQENSKLTSYTLRNPDVTESLKRKYKVFEKYAMFFIESYEKDDNYYCGVSIDKTNNRCSLTVYSSNGLRSESSSFNLIEYKDKNEFISLRRNYSNANIYLRVNAYKLLNEVNTLAPGLADSLNINNVIHVKQKAQYPFKGGKTFNLNKLRGIKDIYIPNKESSKYYFINRLSIDSSLSTYQIGVAKSESSNTDLVHTDYTEIAFFALNKENYENVKNKDIVIKHNSSGVELIINIQQLLDEHIDYTYEYTSNPNFLSNSNRIEIDSEASCSRIVLDKVKEKAETAVQHVKTINGETIEGTGNIVVSSVSGWDDIIDKPTFSDVALSGNYNDLKNKPVIEQGGVQVFGTHVTNISELKEALLNGDNYIVFDTYGVYLEVEEKIVVPDNTIIYAYNGYIKRKAGYDGILIEIRRNVHILGLTIDGNRENVVAKNWSTAIEIKFSNVSVSKIGSELKDCTIIHGNDGVMYMGWHNVIKNCIFRDMGSAGVHYSGCYHSKVIDCTFDNCCLEAKTYGHSEGAILWSNYTENSLVENNYFKDCAEYAIGGIDSDDNNGIIISKNTIYRTKGIGGNMGRHNAVYNVIIKDNIIIDSLNPSDYAFGILLYPSTNTEGQVNPYSPTNIKVTNNVIINGGLFVYGNHSNISNNTVINFKNHYNACVELNLCNSTVSGNTFIDCFVDNSKQTNSGFRISGKNTVFTGNRILFENRAFYLTSCYNLTFRDNYVNCIKAAMYNQSPVSYRINLFNNVFCRGGYAGWPFVIPDGSVVDGNLFIGITDKVDGEYRADYVVTSESKDVIVRNNRYIGAENNDGTVENGCINEGNIKLSMVDKNIQITSPYNLTNITANDTSYVPIIVGLPFVTKLVPASGYKLPDSIQITYTKQDGTTATLLAGNWDAEYEHGTGEPDWLKWHEFKDYVYDKNTGYVYIPVSQKEMKIIAEGVAV